MDNGDNQADASVRMQKLAVGKAVCRTRVGWVEVPGVSHMGLEGVLLVGDNRLACTPLTHRFSIRRPLNVFAPKAPLTGVTEMIDNKLGIQPILDFVDGGAEIAVHAGFPFNLFNGVDGRGVVLATEFTGNLREA